MQADGRRHEAHGQVALCAPLAAVCAARPDTQLSGVRPAARRSLRAPDRSPPLVGHASPGGGRAPLQPRQPARRRRRRRRPQLCADGRAAPLWLGTEEPGVREVRRQQACDGRGCAPVGWGQTSEYRERLKGRMSRQSQSTIGKRQERLLVVIVIDERQRDRDAGIDQQFRMLSAARHRAASGPSPRRPERHHHRSRAAHRAPGVRPRPAARCAARCHRLSPRLSLAASLRDRVAV